MRKKKRVYLVRVMTKGHGLHQRRIDADFKPEDILWIDICESVQGKPLKSILSDQQKEVIGIGPETTIGVGGGDGG